MAAYHNKDQWCLALELESGLLKRWGFEDCFWEDLSPHIEKEKQSTTPSDIPESYLNRSKTEVDQNEVDGESSLLHDTGAQTALAKETGVNHLASSQTHGVGGVGLPLPSSVSHSCSVSVSERDGVNFQQALECITAGEWCDSLVYIDRSLELDPSCVASATLKAHVMNVMENHLEALKTVAKVKFKDRSRHLATEGLTALRHLQLLATADLWSSRHDLGGISSDHLGPRPGTDRNGSDLTEASRNVPRDHGFNSDSNDNEMSNIQNKDRTVCGYNDEPFAVEDIDCTLGELRRGDWEDGADIERNDLQKESGVKGVRGDFIQPSHISLSQDGGENHSSGHNTVILEVDKLESDVGDGAREISDGDTPDLTQQRGSLPAEEESEADHDMTPASWDVQLESLIAVCQSSMQGSSILLKRNGSKKRVTLQASRKIWKGEILFRETPQFLEQDIASCTISACANCGVSLARPEEVFTPGQLASPELKRALKKCWKRREITPCQSCRRVVYCGEVCRDEVWESYHKAICPWSPNTSIAMLYDVRKSFREVLANDGSSWQGWWNAEFSPVFVARLITTVLVRDEKSSSTLETDSTSGIVKKGNLGGCLEHLKRKYPLTSQGSAPPSELVPKMAELMTNVLKRSRPARHSLSQENFDEAYRLISANSVTFHDPADPLTQFIEKVTKDKKLFNKIGKYFHGQPPRARFHGLFPLTSSISHSCVPNVELISKTIGNRPGILARAVRDIEASEELSVSLVDGGNSKKQRQELLWKKFGVQCHCVKCHFEGVGPHVCTHCGRRAQSCEDMTSGAALTAPSVPETSTSSVPSPSQRTTSSLSSTKNRATSDLDPEAKVEGVSTSFTRPFPHCGRCRRAWYCSSSCQKEAWVKGHKKICRQ